MGTGIRMHLKDLINMHKQEMQPNSEMTDIQYTYFQGYCNALSWVEATMKKEDTVVSKKG